MAVSLFCDQLLACNSELKQATFLSTPTSDFREGTGLKTVYAAKIRNADFTVTSAWASIPPSFWSGDDEYLITPPPHTHTLFNMFNEMLFLGNLKT